MPPQNVLCDRKTGIHNPNQTPTEVYATLFNYWSKDIQEAMKSLLKEVIEEI